MPWTCPRCEQRYPGGVSSPRFPHWSYLVVCEGCADQIQTDHLKRLPTKGADPETPVNDGLDARASRARHPDAGGPTNTTERGSPSRADMETSGPALSPDEASAETRSGARRVESAQPGNNCGPRPCTYNGDADAGGPEFKEE